MKKFLMLAAVIMFVASLGLGGVCAYQYFQLRQDCAQIIVRAEDKARTAVAATGTVQEAALKKEAEDARKGAMFICEDSRSRQNNYLLAGSVAPVLIVLAVALLFFSRRTELTA